MAEPNDQINQEEIERLLQQQSSEQPSSAGTGGGPSAGASSSASPMDQNQIEALLSQGEQGSRAAQGSDAPGAADGGPMKPDEIDQLLTQAGAGTPPERQPRAPKAKAAEGGEGIAPADIEQLLDQAQQALESIDSPSPAGRGPGLLKFEFEQFLGEPASTETATLDLISDVQLDLKIELGRTNMYLEDVLKLRKGSVVPLDKLAGDPVDIYVNDRLIARGEILVLNDNFCVRVGELIVGSDLAG